jgi:BirA family transcriptional regulator, biotin operon repressor / biotin---[acetyl-CoA-carboxylase] ligase
MQKDYIGHKIIRFGSLDSTNDYCRKLMESGHPEEGTVIVADRQLRGRGLAGNSWESEEGKNLTFSAILHPLFLHPEDQFFLSMSVSLGIVRYLDAFAGNITIKWPNDIYAGNQKIAGILIENTIIENSTETSIAGIGININQTSFSNRIPDPVSLKLITGRDMDLDECLAGICKGLNYWYVLLKQGNKQYIRSRYTERLFGINKTGVFRSGDRKFNAIIRGTDNYGRLLLELPDKSIEHYNLKEVRFILS